MKVRKDEKSIKIQLLNEKKWKFMSFEKVEYRLVKITLFRFIAHGNL